MPVELIDPPALVQVRDRDGRVRRALLLARRADRAYLQVNRGPGDNVLRWLPCAQVRPVPAAAGRVSG